MNLQTFDFNEAPVRVLMRDEQPWFVAADVCRVLELTNPSMACEGLDEDETITLSNAEGNPRAGIPHQLRLVSESGLYALVFNSRKPEAKKFRKWVTAEVLPALRQTGRYEVRSEAAEVVTLSVLRYTREACQGWPLERQMEFGLLVRRYAKSMGLVFKTEHEPEMGRVFVFPRLVLETVRQSCQRQVALPDGDAVDFSVLLEALKPGVIYKPETVRELAKNMRLFQRIFHVQASAESERSGFGRVCERFHLRPFPNGLTLQVRGAGNHRRYEVSLHTPELSLAS